MGNRLGGTPLGAFRSLLRFDAPQILTPAQKTLAWQNIGYPAPITYTASATLPASATAADVRFGAAATAAATLAMPASASISAGFSTGIVSNETALYILTIAVGAGDKLDGVTNGTLPIAPFQKVSFYYDTDGWHTVWADRNPTVYSRSISGVVSADIAIPPGYASFELCVENIVVATNGAGIGYRTSLDGTTFPAGASQYTNVFKAEVGGADQSSQVGGTYGYVTVGGLSNSASYAGASAGLARLFFDAKYFTMIGQCFYVNATPALVMASMSSTGGAGLNPVAIRIFSTSGNFAANVQLIARGA